MSHSVRPHRQQPTRLLRPWDSPGKNAGVGCHFLLQQRNYKEAKNNYTLSVGTNYGQYGTKRPKSICHFWGARSKSRDCSWFLHNSITKGVGRPPMPFLSPLKGPKQGKLVLVFAPWCCSTSPNEILVEFPVCPLINFYWLKSSRTQISNTLNVKVWSARSTIV